MFQTKIKRKSEGSRVAIPAEIRQSLGLKEGDTVLFELHDGEAIVTTRKAQLDRGRALFRQFVPAGAPSIVDEPIAERPTCWRARLGAETLQQSEVRAKERRARKYP